MSLVYRPFDASDRKPVFRMFRDSIWDYMLRLGMVQPGDRYDLDALLDKQQDMYLHLENTAAEDWVAEDSQLGVLGWARSIERGGHLQLTHFFVSPKAQSGGIGRKLLQKAFAPGRGRQRSIIATTDERALSLYLRHGVDIQAMGVSFVGRPQRRDACGDLRIELAEPGDDTLRQLLTVDCAVLGFERSVDLEYLSRQQPVFLGYRDDAVAGYAFGHNGKASGPAAALDPADLPALLQQIENSACDAGVDELMLMIPGTAAPAMDWALASGYRIDPFYEILLASYPLKLDRYLLTDSTFIW